MFDCCRFLLQRLLFFPSTTIGSCGICVRWMRGIHIHTKKIQNITKNNKSQSVKIYIQKRFQQNISWSEKTTHGKTDRKYHGKWWLFNDIRFISLEYNVDHNAGCMSLLSQKGSKVSIFSLVNFTLLFVLKLLLFCVWNLAIEQENMPRSETKQQTIGKLIYFKFTVIFVCVIFDRISEEFQHVARQSPRHSFFDLWNLTKHHRCYLVSLLPFV